MQIIDFDAKFTEVLNDWIEKNRSRFRKPDDMENEVPDVYLRWLNTPASWLGGARYRRLPCRCRWRGCPYRTQPRSGQRR